MQSVKYYLFQIYKYVTIPLNILFAIIFTLVFVAIQRSEYFRKDGSFDFDSYFDVYKDFMIYMVSRYLHHFNAICFIAYLILRLILKGTD
jgi:hypothetical protein